MFQWHQEMARLDLQAGDIYQLQRSLNRVQIAPPGFPVQESEAYLCLFAAGQGIRAAVVLHLPVSRHLAFYLNEPGPVPPARSDKLLNEGIGFAESMGFLLGDLDFHLLSDSEKGELWESLPLRGGLQVPPATVKKPPAVEKPALTVESPPPAAGKAAPVGEKSALPMEKPGPTASKAAPVADKTAPKAAKPESSAEKAPIGRRTSPDPSVPPQRPQSPLEKQQPAPSSPSSAFSAQQPRGEATGSEAPEVAVLPLPRTLQNRKQRPTAAETVQKRQFLRVILGKLLASL